MPYIFANFARYLTPVLENAIQVTLFVLFQLCLIVQLYFLIGKYGKLAAFKIPPRQADAGPVMPISVIISARNEAKNLSQFLPAILTQDYPDFEVILINDCSSDGSDILLMEMQANYSRQTFWSQP